MRLDNVRIGFALTGSFCTFGDAFTHLGELIAEGAIVTPIVSDAVHTMDTRFCLSKDTLSRLEAMTNAKALRSIEEVEPIGPKALLDVMLILPCTGNTLSKIANGITDTAVTMASKSHRRNLRPLVLSISSNDALGASARNLGTLLNQKLIYFTPFYQDDPVNKPNSLVAKNDLVVDTIIAALEGKQLQPLIYKEG